MSKAINQKVSSRIDYLDTAKFIGLILVCFCHIPYAEGNFHIWVYSFHMPLFFLVSGLFFNPAKSAIGKSAKQLLLPFLSFNVIALVITAAIGSASAHSLIIPHVDWNDILYGKYPVGPSWFLLSLFCIRSFSTLVAKLTGDKILLLSAIIVFLLFFMTKNAALWSVFNAGSSVLGLPFYLTGYYLKNLFTNPRHLKKWYMLLSASAVSILAILNGQVGIHEGSYGNNILLFILFGLSGTVALLSLSTIVRIPKTLTTVFMEGALFFICMHTLIFEYIILIYNKLSGDFSGNTLFEKIIFTILTFTVSYPVIKCLIKYAPFLLGKSSPVKTSTNKNEITYTETLQKS